MAGGPYTASGWELLTGKTKELSDGGNFERHLGLPGRRTSLGVESITNGL